MLHSALLFHGNYIFAEIGELLTAVGDYALSALFFKGRGESFGLFSRAFLRPRRRHLEGGRVGLERLPVRAYAAMHADRVGYQLAGLIPPGLYVSHC